MVINNNFFLEKLRNNRTINLHFLVKKQKAQMKIQQMAFMLMAITLFFILAGMFVLVMYSSHLKESASALSEQNAMLLVEKLANSPEFSCGEAYGGQRINCVDADKIMMLRENIAKYENFWGVSNIEIRTITNDDAVECNVANYPNCNVIKLRNEDISSEYSNFISLCRKDIYENNIYDKCELARLMVGYNDNQ